MLYDETRILSQQIKNLRTHTIKRGDWRTDDADPGDKTAFSLLWTYFLPTFVLPSVGSTWCSFSLPRKSLLTDDIDKTGADAELKADSSCSPAVSTKLPVLCNFF